MIRDGVVGDGVSIEKDVCSGEGGVVVLLQSTSRSLVMDMKSVKVTSHVRAATRVKIIANARISMSRRRYKDCKARRSSKDTRGQRQKILGQEKGHK